MTLELEEVERRLRCGDWNVGFADAIKSHRERCVDAGPLAALADSWEALADKPSMGEFHRGQDASFRMCAAALRNLLPPQKSALQRAIEMVEGDDILDRSIRHPRRSALLALLREAEKEAGR